MAPGEPRAPPRLHYPRCVPVRFVITEHPGALTEERRRHYERIRRRLERIAGRAVQSVSYPELRSLAGAPAVVLSGSFAPWAVHDQDALGRLGEVVRAFRGPVFGICAGMQLQARFAGGTVARAAVVPATGFHLVDVRNGDDLFQGLPRAVSVYAHHTEEITVLPESFRVLASSRECAVEAIADSGRPWWGTQFHPEEFTRTHPAGELVLRNFFALAGLTPARV